MQLCGVSFIFLKIFFKNFLSKFNSGVCKGILTLPIPSSAPECFKSLMTMCWNQQPSNRPSFQEIIKHLDLSKHEIILFEQDLFFLYLL